MNQDEMVRLIRSDLHSHIDPIRAKHAVRYFKSLPGQYGEGDIFLGISVPNIRQNIRTHRTILTISIVKHFLESQFHEERLWGVLSLVELYRKARSEPAKKEIVLVFLEELRADHINNWDLVDSSAHHILGHFLEGKSKDILFALAQTDHLWSQRAAVISCMAFAKNGETQPLYSLVIHLMNHPHDLIHKACGWLLRVTGHTRKDLLCEFLNQYYQSMPRTMLRYAIEKFSPEERQAYLYRG